MNKDEPQTTILSNEQSGWERTAVQGLVPAPKEPESGSRPNNRAYYVVGLIAIAALLVWIFRHKLRI